MKLRIGVSQRRLPREPHASARDALDAAWSAWFISHWPNVQFLAIPNFDDPALAVLYAEDWELTGFILSGGGDVNASPERVGTEVALLDFAGAQSMPVLGVCRGMQMLHQYGGGELTPVPGHVNTVHEVLVEDCRQEVNSWHEFGIQRLCRGWSVLAKATDGTVEAMQHNRLPWLGLMWHPERTQGTIPIMWKWIERCFENRFGAT